MTTKRGTHAGTWAELDPTPREAVFKAFRPFIEAGWSILTEVKPALELQPGVSKNSMDAAKDLFKTPSAKLPAGTNLDDLQRWYRGLRYAKLHGKDPFPPDVPFVQFENLSPEQQKIFNGFLKTRVEERLKSAGERVGQDGERVAERNQMFRQVMNVPGGTVITFDNLADLWILKIKRVYHQFKAKEENPAHKMSLEAAQVYNQTAPAFGHQQSGEVHHWSGAGPSHAVSSLDHQISFEDFNQDQKHLLTRFALRQLMHGHWKHDLLASNRPLDSLAENETILAAARRMTFDNIKAKTTKGGTVPDDRTIERILQTRTAMLQTEQLRGALSAPELHTLVSSSANSVAQASTPSHSSQSQLNADHIKIEYKNLSQEQKQQMDNLAHRRATYNRDQHEHRQMPRVQDNHIEVEHKLQGFENMKKSSSTKSPGLDNKTLDRILESRTKKAKRELKTAHHHDLAAYNRCQPLRRTFRARVLRSDVEL